MSDLQCASRLILARHGAADYESPLLDDEGGSLSRAGRQQSRDLARQLTDQRIAHIYTSTLARAVQTGEIAAAALDVAVTTRSALVEFGCGDLAGVTREQDPVAPFFQRWLTGELDVPVPGAETGYEVIARLRGVLVEIADLHRGETVLVISHGGLLSLGIPSLVRMSGQQAQRLGNCQWVEVDIDGDDWVCRAW